MSYFNRLELFDMAYNLNLNILIESLNSDFKGDSKEVYLYKLLSLFYFNKDYKYLPKESQSKFNTNKNKIKESFSFLNKKIKSLSQKDLFDLLSFKHKDICSSNKLELFDYVYNSNRKLLLDNEFIKSICNSKIFPLRHLLQFNEVVNSSEKFIHNFMLNNCVSIEIFIEYFDSDKKQNRQLFFPKFTDDEINKWIIDYTNFKDFNIHYLNYLVAHNDNNYYKINAKTRLYVQNKIKDFWNDNKNKMATISNDLCVSFSDDLSELVKIERNGRSEKITFSDEWISANLDYPTILNNLIYIFKVCDYQMRINETYVPRAEDVLSSIFEQKIKGGYGSDSFQFLQSRRQLIFQAYVTLLKTKYKINIEEVYKWFVETYLPTEFGIKEFSIHINEDNYDYLTKCRNIYPLVERLLKQYAVYVENGEFSQELFKATKKSYKLHDYPSLIKNKYYELIDENEIKQILFLLFNNQSLINFSHINGKDIYEENFCLLISKHKIFKDDFNNSFCQDRIDYLIKHNVIRYGIDGYLVFVSQEEIKLLFDLYTVGFINSNNVSKIENKILVSYLNKGYLRTSSNLLSSSEADFLSYYLNNEKFSNALALRNKYIHTETDDSSEKEHKDNYYIGLRMLAIVIIKINDDLCQKFGYK